MTQQNEPQRFRTVADLEPDVARALLRWGLSLADTKHRLGLRLSEWINGAPALEATVGMAAMTQDELGHARSLFFVLRQFPDAPPELNTENDLDRRVFYNPTLLNSPWDSWLDVIAVSVLLDQALTVAIEALRDSRFSPLQGLVAKILQEEIYHRIFGESWLGRLAQDEDTALPLQAALERVWPVVVAWFGPDDDSVTGGLVKAGILAEAPGVLRKRWEARITPLFQKFNLRVPKVSTNWDSWDPVHREVTHEN